MKYMVLALTGLLALGACNRNLPQSQCDRAVYAAKDFKGKLVSSAQIAVANSPTLRAVPVIYGQTAIANGTAKRGTLVFEVNRPLYTPVQDMMNEPITNVYCYE